MEVDKYDYSKHPEAKKLRAGKASSHVPAWQKARTQAAEPKKEVTPALAQTAAQTEPARKAGPSTQAAGKAAPQVKTTSKDSIIKPKVKKEV